MYKTLTEWVRWNLGRVPGGQNEPEFNIFLLS